MGDHAVGRQGSLGHALKRGPSQAGPGVGPCFVDWPWRFRSTAWARSQARDIAQPAAEKVPIERQPYKILVNLVCDPSARIDAARRADLIREWQVLVHRFIGSPWVVSIAPASSPLSNLDLETLKPDAFTSVGPFDKVWLIRIAQAETGSGLVFKGREYDTATRGLRDAPAAAGPRVA